MIGSNVIRSLLTIALAYYGLIANSPAQTAHSLPTNSISVSKTPTAVAQAVVLPQSIPDPLEPLNRATWAFNRGLMTGVIKPTARGYRFIVVKPVRTGIGNFGRNVTYPGRLVNNLLQGKWTGAKDETDRFFCNTFAGGAGFWDVATKWKIPKSDADFGQTFGQWGWKPGCYLMLPIFGPSNERDTVGFAADTAANPLTYFTPFPFNPENPLTYVSPYTYYSAATTYNNLSDTVDSSVRFTQTQKDPYSILQYAWTFARENQIADFQVKGEQDEASLETLQSVFFSFKDPEFPNRAQTRSVSIPATGRKLKFTFWLQPAKAPVVYIVPGLGSHRLADAALALAELVYSQGFSAVCVSSPYNYEFMEQASTVAMPAYTPVDAHDLHVALTSIDRRLTALYPNRVGAKALMGYSMGAFQALFIAATESTNETPLIKFDRYVAINTPVRFLYCISRLDEFYRAPLAWPADERTANIENTFLKVAALSKSSLTPQASLPFEGVESRFLIGLTFRFTLRDMIFSSQQRYDQGILKHPINKLRRVPGYREILEYSYKDYFEKFATPYFRSRGIDLAAPEALEKAGDLRAYGATLRANGNVRLIAARNDILLADEDMEWLEATFEPQRMTIFEKGGHLGNLNHPAVQKAILGALEGLRPPPVTGVTRDRSAGRPAPVAPR
ncbi:MAG TPA: VacJ family lipoprotein [Candidatus Limnocylindria bacterium]|nr:VacJ family lipoprotein [Candidatus Limnocylindria bacterium]